MIVTHPFHPLTGQEVVVIEVQDHCGELAYYRNPKGEQVTIPLSWTTLGSEDPFVVVSHGRSDFRVADLLKLAELLRGLEGLDGQSQGAR